MIAMTTIRTVCVYCGSGSGTNPRFIEAAEAGRVPPGARQLQQRWDSIINLRAALQGTALLGFCLTLALAAT